jgi:hypothetical protein
MGIFIGVVLALAVALLARRSGLDQDRGFYPVIVIVVASYYDLFAVMSGEPGILLAELVPFVLFVGAALTGHGIFDIFHAQLISDPGVPVWWPAFCASYDITAGLYLAWRLNLQQTGTRSTAFLPQDPIPFSFF